MFSDANTTAVAQVVSLIRVNVKRAGTPARNEKRDGSKLVRRWRATGAAACEA